MWRQKWKHTKEKVKKRNEKEEMILLWHHSDTDKFALHFAGTEKNDRKLRSVLITVQKQTHYIQCFNIS